jgi:sulfoxide reductase heme-binding subunit YedZ
MTSDRVAFIKRVILVNAFVPLLLIGWDAAHGNLGANPVELVLRSTGTMALLFLALSLAVTPARHLLGAPWLTKLRRILGLIAFTYACLHVSIYLTLEQGLNPLAVVSDALTRPFILFGLLAFGLLVPMAWTSTQGAIRRLGKRWTQIHKRVYIVAVCACIHYWLEVKADTTKPLIFGLVFGALLLYRYVMREAPHGSRAS